MQKKQCTQYNIAKTRTLIFVTKPPLSQDLYVLNPENAALDSFVLTNHHSPANSDIVGLEGGTVCPSYFITEQTFSCPQIKFLPAHLCPVLPPFALRPAAYTTGSISRQLQFGRRTVPHKTGKEIFVDLGTRQFESHIIKMITRRQTVADLTSQSDPAGMAERPESGIASLRRLFIIKYSSAGASERGKKVIRRARDARGDGKCRVECLIIMYPSRNPRRNKRSGVAGYGRWESRFVRFAFCDPVIALDTRVGRVKEG